MDHLFPNKAHALARVTAIRGVVEIHRLTSLKKLAKNVSGTGNAIVVNEQLETIEELSAKKISGSMRRLSKEKPPLKGVRGQRRCHGVVHTSPH